MAYVTEDKDVKPIIARFVAGRISRHQAETEIRSLERFLDWEVQEALKAKG